MPHLTEAAPQVLAEQPSGVALAGAITTFAAFILGWVLSGIATWRARVFPRAAALLLIVGALIGLPWPLFPSKLVV